MGVYYETIPHSLNQWILDQKMLWVGSAPLSSEGHINLSPKGGQYFGIVDERTFWFMDLSGSGVETTAHLYEPNNGRLVVMFQAFEGPPRILRLWGKGRVLERFSEAFEQFVTERKVEVIPATRSIIILDIDQVGTSCGFSVPRYDFKGYRSTLTDLFDKKDRAYKSGKEGESMDAYWALKSQLSVDGLPGMKRGLEYAQKHQVRPLKKFVGGAEPTVARRPSGVQPMQLFLIAFLGFFIGVMMTLSLVTPEMISKIQKKEMWVV